MNPNTSQIRTPKFPKWLTQALDGAKVFRKYRKIHKIPGDNCKPYLSLEDPRSDETSSIYSFGSERGLPGLPSVAE